MLKQEIIVVPDVHGRTFWKKVMDEKYKDNHIVFLGDYLDPYFQEGDFTSEGVIENFKEIIAFAKANPKRVHLLIGNHDAHYFSLSDDTCRMDTEHADEIFSLFNDNKKLFKVAYRNKKTLFTHAGVTTKWLSQNCIEVNADNVDKKLNSMFSNIEIYKPNIRFDGISNFIYSPLGDIGMSRGGYVPCGSCIWADAKEMMYHSAFYNVENVDDENAETIKLNIELYQITGHSQLRETGMIVHPQNNWWLCDSRECFIWDEAKETLNILENEEN